MNDKPLHWKTALSVIKNLDPDCMIVDQSYGKIDGDEYGSDYYRFHDSNNSNTKMIIKCCHLTGKLDEVCVYTIDGCYVFINSQVRKNEIRHFLFGMLAKEKRMQHLGSRSRILKLALERYWECELGI
jgi:hypothetical protein